ncbi:unnamed protein product [Onchocerca flexuosa]|uniref:Secreted protein n=1 Tax=Onchocerca flexuosa TaxID=387005 RepID=A0A183HFB1_9BILA|nr:unnamed protein product [Onchocerca flexuosa]
MIAHPWKFTQMKEIHFAFLPFSFCFIAINGAPTAATPTGQIEEITKETTENTNEISIPTVDEILEALEDGLKEIYDQQTISLTRRMFFLYK